MGAAACKSNSSNWMVWCSHSCLLSSLKIYYKIMLRIHKRKQIAWMFHMHTSKIRPKPERIDEDMTFHRVKCMHN